MQNYVGFAVDTEVEADSYPHEAHRLVEVLRHVRWRILEGGQ
jgi:hypothetical protein